MSSSPVYSPRWTSMIDQRVVLVVADPVRLPDPDVHALARAGDRVSPSMTQVALPVAITQCSARWWWYW